MPSESGTTLVLEDLMRQISWIPGILPADLCNLMIRSTDRPPYKLKTTLEEVFVRRLKKK